MAKVYFLGTATAVAQESRATPANVEIGDIFSLLVNGLTVATYTALAGAVADVTAGLTTAWNASTHPYATLVTASNQTTYVKLLSDVAGMPFTITATAVDGGGTNTQTLTMSTPVANAGPNAWDVATNWSGGAVPVNNDEVFIEDLATPILWGLDQSAVTLTSLTVSQTYTGKIGLDWTVFTTAADGVTSSALASEYRECYLKIGCSGLVDLGKQQGAGTPDGSGRIMIDFGATAPTVVVHQTADESSETGRNAVRLKCNSASAALIVRLAPGGVGIATEKATETTTIGTISVNDLNSTTVVCVGAGVTLTSWNQTGGTHTLEAAATIPIVKAEGGILTTHGDYTITHLTNDGAVIYANHWKTGGSAVATAVLNDGTTTTEFNGRAVTWDLVVKGAGATFNSTAATVVTSTRYNPEDVEV